GLIHAALILRHSTLRLPANEGAAASGCDAATGPRRSLHHIVVLAPVLVSGMQDRRVLAAQALAHRNTVSCHIATLDRVTRRNGGMFLTLDEAASALRLHPVTLRALAAAGRVPAVKIGRAWRFLEIDLLAWARANYERAD